VTMPTVDERADEILAIELTPALERRAVALFDAVPTLNGSGRQRPRYA